MTMDELDKMLFRADFKASRELISDLCGVLHDLVDAASAGLTPINAGVDGWVCYYCEQDTDEVLGEIDHAFDCALIRARQMLRDIEDPT